MGNRVAVAKVAEALKNSGGRVGPAAKALGCSRSTVYRKLEQSPVLAELVSDIREDFIDEAEDQIVTLVRRGDGATVRFILQTLGRHRGYVKGVEVSQVNTFEEGLAALKGRRGDDDQALPESTETS